MIFLCITYSPLHTSFLENLPHNELVFQITKQKQCLNKN